MKRLMWINANGVRAFGCVGCRWTYPVEEFTPEFSDTDLREKYRSHNCDNPQFKCDDQSTIPAGTVDSTLQLADCDQVLQDLCGLKGKVLASIESLSSPSNNDLAAFQAELDSVRSLLWLHMRPALVPVKDGPQVPSTNDEKRRWRRYDFQVPVTLITSNGNKKIQARGTDLNEGGMTVYAKAELTLGDVLNVEFRPPFSNTVVNLAVVVKNQNGNRYGMEFVDTKGAEHQEIVLLRTMVKMLEARVSYYEERESKKVLD
jgi:PilZ domain